ncbi:DUF5067 domain-containing protein [Bifidobacterium avesanii]|uniref:DUF5067 domain-containing protein n=1 Tax=Bifidobacterium avesanii TaxID=1798157 RepID=A0A7K3TH15_9BIFI|nr:DUF5067 domain-containing protein [Bifidobacterium avesanii]KAB8290631.1 hypothetical protein DSM100685_1424 [Bifidobacterium avesanii]NEG77999.1 DUF5067 domain-containing protein [Bifidobacterium avesanii]
MGLFDGTGRDRNHDGYVSPFDADETQAYVDPAKALDRETRAQAKAEAKAKARDDHNAAQVKAARQSQRSKAQSSARASSPSASHTQPPVTLRPMPVGGPQTGQDTQSVQYSQTAGTDADVNAGATAANDDDQLDYRQLSDAGQIKPERPDGGARHAGHGAAQAARSKAQQAETKTSPGNGWATAALVAAFVFLGATEGSWKYQTKFFAAGVVAVLAFVGLLRYGTDRRRKGVGRAIAALVIAALMAFNGVQGWQAYDGYLSRWHNSYSSSAGSSDSSDDATEEYPEPNFHDGELSLTGYDNQSGTAKIVSATMGPKDEFNENRDTIIVTYSWTNTSSTNVSFEDVFSPTVFQGGVEIKQSYLYPEYGDQTPQSYDRESQQTKLKPGTGKDVTVAYALRDTSAPVEVWLSDGSYDDVLAQRFDIKGSSLGATVQPQKIEDPMQTDGMVTDGDLEDMTKFVNYHGTVYAKVLDAYRSRNDSDGSPTVTVRIAWVNRTSRPLGFNYYIEPTAFVGSESLKQTYLYDKDDNPIPGYDERSWSRDVKPGMMDTATLVYKLPDANAKQVELTMEGGDSEHKVDESKTLDIADQYPGQ